MVQHISGAHSLPSALERRRLVRYDSIGLRRQQSCSTENSEPLIPPVISEQGPNNCQGLKGIFWHPLCILLICFPLGIVSHFLEWGDSYTFWLNFFCMVPLAKILGDATEELAGCINNDMISGLLNATFGNAVEMIMTVAMLYNHQYLMVKFSLVGSVISNMLLVLGMSFFAGGLSSSGQQQSVREKENKFSPMGALSNTAMLLLACMVLCLVTIFNYVDNIDEDDMPLKEEKMYMLPISRSVSVFILMAYAAFIVFQLFTHRECMKDEPEDDEEHEEPLLSLGCSVGLLFFATILVSISSEFLTDALDGALKNSGIGKSFLGVILVPIVGNACEHAAAIRFAIKDRMGLAVGIAVGSSVQIALFVAPFSVLVGWAMCGNAGMCMNLDFGALDVTVVTLSVILIFAIVVDGKSNWLEGYLLMTAYAVVAVLYWYLPATEPPK